MSHLSSEVVVLGRHPVACVACGATFLGRAAARCPVCGLGRLEASSIHAQGEPEQIVPDTLTRAGVEATLAEAVRGVRYACPELRAELLAERAERSWWPLWLVDGHLVGGWAAQAGTNYEVQSSREVLKGGRWVTEPHVDTRIRWEERVGTLELTAHNVAVEALRDHRLWASRLGALEGAEAEVGAVPDGLIRLPDRSSDEAYPEALLGFQGRGAAYCQRAMGCDHVEGFALHEPPEDLHWTWLLVPIWTTWYLDDLGVERTLWVHGATGSWWGPLMASPRKGWMWAALWVTLGGLCLGISVVLGLLGIVLWPLLVVAALGGVVGFLLLCLALVPLLAPRRHNKEQLSRL